MCSNIDSIGSVYNIGMFGVLAALAVLGVCGYFLEHNQKFPISKLSRKLTLLAHSKFSYKLKIRI